MKAFLSQRNIFIFSLIFICISIPNSVKCSNILVVNYFGSESHFVGSHAIASRLADIGHNVTYLAGIRMKQENPKINYFYPKVVIQVLSGVLDNYGDESLRATTTENAFTFGYLSSEYLCQLMLDNEEIQAWIAKLTQSSYDLMIYDSAFNDCFLGLTHKFKIPHIALNLASFYPWEYDLYGIVPESSYIPDFRLNFTQDMGFLNRVQNTLSTLYMSLYLISNDYNSRMSEIIRNGMNDSSIPDMVEMKRQVSIVFLNSYFPSEYARSLPPFVIPVGGFYISTKNQIMSNEIKIFIEKFGKEGFLYISFGTIFKLSDKSFNELFKIMTVKFPQFGFIFKWTGELPKESGHNVLFVSWAPQQLLLAHPNIRAFVSHCGMLGTNEALHFGVPVVAIPGFADQDFNAETLVRSGVATRLELTDLNEENMEGAIRDILFNKKYKERMNVISSLYHDRPQSPLDTAVWWTEYVLRNTKSGNELTLLMKPLGINQYWFQRRLIDVYIFIFSIIVIITYVSSRITLVIFKVYMKKKDNKKDKKKTK